MRARTEIEHKANSADLAMFNLARDLAELSRLTMSRELAEISDELFRRRFSVRVHMHPDDISETADN